MSHFNDSVWVNVWIKRYIRKESSSVRRGAPHTTSLGISVRHGIERVRPVIYTTLPEQGSRD